MCFPKLPAGCCWSAPRRHNKKPPGGLARGENARGGRPGFPGSSAAIASLHWRWRLWPPLNSLDISISLYHTAPTTTSCLDGFISLLIVCPLVHFPHSQKFKCEHHSYLLFKVSYDSHCPWVKFKLLQWYLRSLCVGCLFKLSQLPSGT